MTPALGGALLLLGAVSCGEAAPGAPSTWASPASTAPTTPARESAAPVAASVDRTPPPSAPSASSSGTPSAARAPTAPSCAGCEAFNSYHEDRDCYRFRRGSAPSDMNPGWAPTAWPVEVVGVCDPSCCGIPLPNCSGCRAKGDQCYRYKSGVDYEQGWCAPRCCGGR